MKTPSLPTPEDLTLPEIMARFPDEATAIAYFETIRWPNGPECPHCGNKHLWKITANTETKVRHGLWQCAECKKQFRATVGTIFEDSHLPLNIWLIAWYILSGAKKGISALQMKRHLGIGSYKCAWHLCHRIRHALSTSMFTEKMSGAPIEVDETYVGGKTIGKGCKAGRDNKTPVVSLVQRGGQVRSQVMERVTGANLQKAVRENVQICETVYTDEHFGYRGLSPKFNHKSVKHRNNEYVRKDGAEKIHTNTVEGYFSLLKRGIIGSFHHVSKKHLPKYLSEFDFRYNTREMKDGERTVAGLQKATGKRLTYKPLTKKV